MAAHNEANQPTVINPVYIPGLLSPVQHPGNPHGGIPLSLVRSGNIEVLVDPWLHQDAFDSAVLLDESDTPLVDKIIQPGEQNQRITMDLPAALLRNGINRLRLRVKRVSQDPVTSVPLVVLYHTPRPGADAAGSGDNPNLIMTLPADVVANGVSADRAKQGVDVTLRYVHMREHDVIKLDCDSQEKQHTVTAAQAAAGNVVLKLFTSDFWQDNPKFALRFRATDQLGNTSGPLAFWSGTTLIDVHLRKQPELDLKRPEVLEAKEGGGTILNFVKDFYNAAFANVMVNYVGSYPGQTVRVKWIGRNTTYTTDIQTVSTAGQTLNFRIPRLEVIDTSGGSHAELTYTVRWPGTNTDIPSRDLDLTITRQKYILPEPTINGARNNLRVYYPTLDAPYTARMALHGVVTRYGDEVPITTSDYTDIPIPSGWITENLGRSVMFNYTLKRTNTTEPLIFSWLLRIIL
jgi:hypothetical protein